MTELAIQVMNVIYDEYVIFKNSTFWLKLSYFLSLEIYIDSSPSGSTLDFKTRANCSRSISKLWGN